MHVGVYVYMCVVYRDWRWMKEISTLIWDCKQSPHTDKEGKSRNSAHTSLYWSSLSLSIIIMHVCLSVRLSVSLCLSVYLSVSTTWHKVSLHMQKSVLWWWKLFFFLLFNSPTEKVKGLSNDIMFVKIFCSLFLPQVFLYICLFIPLLFFIPL